MKNLKKYVALLLVVAIMLTFAGCGKMTAEKLVVKMLAAVAETPMTSGSMDMDFDMSIGIQGISMEMGMAMTMDVLMDMDPYQAYMDTEITVEMLGQSMTETMQTYVQMEDQGITTYAHSDSTDLWTKTTMDLPPEEQLRQNYDWLKSKPVEELTLAEETQTIGDHEVYVLSCTISGAEMQEMFSAMISLQQNLEDMDMSALEVPAVFYVDTQTFLPVKMEMEIQGMDDMMSGLLDQVIGEDLSSLGMEIELGSVIVVFRDIGYDAVEMPAVPQEGLNAKAA